MGDEEDDGEAAILTELLTAVMSGNTKSLATLVDRVREGELAVKSGKKEPVEQLVNTQFGSSKASCLHLAAKEGHRLVPQSLRHCVVCILLKANGNLALVLGC